MIPNSVYHEAAIALRQLNAIHEDSEVLWISDLLGHTIDLGPLQDDIVKRVSGQCLRLLNEWLNRFSNAGATNGEYDEEEEEQIMSGSQTVASIADAGGLEQLVLIRDDMVESAEAFLDNEKVEDKTIEEKIDFLIFQGLRLGELKLACKNHGVDNWDSLLNLVEHFKRIHSHPDTGVTETEEETKIREASEFLFHPAVKDRSLDQRIEFLRTKMDIDDELLKAALAKGSGDGTIPSFVPNQSGKSTTYTPKQPIKPLKQETSPSSRAGIPLKGTSAPNKPSTKSTPDSASISPEVQKVLTFLKHPSVAGKSIGDILPFLTSKGMKRRDVEKAYAIIESNTENMLPPRTPKVEQALQFLKHPSVVGKPIEQIIPFLTSKGLSRSDVEAAHKIQQQESSQSPRTSMVEQGYKFLTHPKVQCGQGQISLAKARVFLIKKGLTNAEFELALSRARDEDPSTNTDTDEQKTEKTDEGSLRPSSNISSRKKGLTVHNTNGTVHTPTGKEVLSPRLEQAIRFLNTPEIVSTTQISERVLFLKAQNLSDPEIAEAFNHVNASPSSASEKVDILRHVVVSCTLFLQHLMERVPSGQAAEVLSLPSLSPVHDPSQFVPCSTWRGRRPDRVFKLGSQGLGYYPDDGVPELGRPFHLAVAALNALLQCCRFAPWAKMHPGCLMETLAFLESPALRLWAPLGQGVSRDPVQTFAGYAEAVHLHRHRNAVTGEEAKLHRVFLHYEDCEEWISKAAELEAAGQELRSYVQYTTLVCSSVAVMSQLPLTFTPSDLDQRLTPGLTLGTTFALVCQHRSIGPTSAPYSLNWEHGFMLARAFHSRFAPLFAGLEGRKWPIRRYCASMVDGSQDLHTALCAVFVMAGLLSGAKQYTGRFESEPQTLQHQSLLIDALLSVQRDHPLLDENADVVAGIGFSASPLLVASGCASVYATQVGQVDIGSGFDATGEDRFVNEVKGLCEATLGGALFCPPLFSPDAEYADVSQHTRLDECIRFSQTTLFQMKTQLVALIADKIEQTKLMGEHGEALRAWVAGRLRMHGKWVFASSLSSYLVSGQLAKHLVVEMEPKVEGVEIEKEVFQLPQQTVQIAQTSFLTVVVVGSTLLANANQVETPQPGSMIVKVWDALAYLAAFAVPVREADAIEQWNSVLFSLDISSNDSSAAEEVQGDSSQLEGVQDDSSQLETVAGQLAWVVEMITRHTQDTGFGNWVLSARLEYLLRTSEKWLLGEIIQLSTLSVDESPKMVHSILSFLLKVLKFEQQSLNQTCHHWLTQVVSNVESNEPCDLPDTVQSTADGREWSTVPYRLALVPMYCDVMMETHPSCTSTETLAFALGSVSTSLGGDPSECALALGLLLFHRLEEEVRAMLGKKLETLTSVERDPVDGDELVLTTLLFTLLKAVSFQVMDVSMEKVEGLLEWVRECSAPAHNQLVVVLFGVIARTKDIPRRTQLATWYLEKVHKLAANHSKL